MGIQRLRHSPTDEDKYSYSKRKIQALLHLTDEEILRLQKQSKEMVTEIFEEELKTDTLEERILRDANSSPWERMVMTIHNIKNHVVGIEQIKEL
ncbi:MAG: hypothetical protein LBI53_02330 [Candidatus Peribacteria bacterium]|jgi:hypothetical protein|nr:hypothetical protein [Candidatus Peribacteria bacterium]